MKRILRQLIGLVCVFVFLGTALTALADDRTNAYRLFPPKLEDGVYPRHYRPDRTVDFERLKLDIKVLMNEQRVEGTAHYQFRPIHDNVTSIRFDAVQMEIQAVGSPTLELDWTYSDDAVHVTFPEPLPDGESLKISITYRSSESPTASAASFGSGTGMYFTDSKHVAAKEPDQLFTLNEAIGGSLWFPCPDYPNDRMITTMVVTVPKEFVTLSNGLLVRSVEEGEWRKDYWKQSIPHVIYLVSLVVGKFDIVRDEWRDIPVEYYVEAGRKEDARPSMGKTPAMMEFFSNYLDYPYPYEKYAQVAVRYFTAGGMEHTTCTTLHEWACIDEEARLDTNGDGLIMHELAHQWFGDLVTCESWPELYLNEGFATLSDALWYEHTEGEDGYLEAIMGKMESYIGSSKSYTRPIVENRFANPDEMFDSHSYPKAACVLHMLRWQLGDDLFRKSLNHYLKANAPGLVHTKDLMRAIEETTGRPMDQFFEQWIYRPGHPKLKVTHQWLSDRKKVKLTIEQTQKMEKGDAAFAFPLDIEIQTKDKTIRRTIDVAHIEETTLIDCPEAPKSVNIDPSLRVLMELEHKKSMDMLLHDLEEGSTIVVRIRAARALDKHRKERITKALAKTMNDDPSERVQVEAAKMLRKIKNDRSKEILIAACTHSNPDIRQNAVRALGDFHKDKQAWDAVCQRFKTDKSIHVIASAAGAMARIERDGAYKILKPGLSHKSFRETIRKSVLNALVDLSVPQTHSWLVKYSKDPYSKGLRTTAIRGLGRLASKTEKDEKAVLDLLLAYLKSASPSIRRAAISGLRSLGDKDAIPHLQTVQNNDSDEGIQRSAKNAITEIRKENESGLTAQNAERIDDLEKENNDLKKRLEKLESAIEQIDDSAKKPEDESKE